jgi:hypothetical protein
MALFSREDSESGLSSRDDGISWGERRLIYESYIWDAQTGEYISKLLQKMAPNWCGLTKARGSLLSWTRTAC